MKTLNRVMQGLFLILLINNVSGAVGDINVTVTNELGTALASADVNVQCTGNTGGLYYNLGTTNGSGQLTAAPPVDANCDLGAVEDINFLVQKDGYVQLTFLTENDYNGNADPATDENNRYTLSNVQYGHKITPQREADSNNLAGATVTAGGGAQVSCDENSGTGVFFCAILIANDGGTDDVNVVKDGYVTNTTGDSGDRTAHTSAQQTLTVSSIDFAHIVEVKDGVGNSLTGATVTAGSSSVSCIEATSPDGTYYCAVALADDGGTDDVTASKTGYNSNTGSLSNRTAGGDAQGSITVQLSASSSGTSSGSSGGRDATSSVEVTTVSDEATFNFTSSSIPVKSITVKVNTTVTEPSIVVKNLSDRPSATDDVEGGVVFKYFEITPKNMSNDEIDEAVVEFEISVSWFLENNVEPRDVKLLRWNGSSWESFDAIHLKTSGGDHEFRAVLPGFSTFAAFAEKESTEEEDDSTPTGPAPQTNDCGNAVCESALGETCSTCPLDCGCGTGSKCELGECVESDTTSTTGTGTQQPATRDSAEASGDNTLALIGLALLLVVIAYAFWGKKIKKGLQSLAE